MTPNEDRPMTGGAGWRTSKRPAKLDLSDNAVRAAVASCLREGGTVFGLDREELADVLLAGGEEHDLYSRLAALIEPENIQSQDARQAICDEIHGLARAAA